MPATKTCNTINNRKEEERRRSRKQQIPEIQARPLLPSRQGDKKEISRPSHRAAQALQPEQRCAGNNNGQHAGARLGARAVVVAAAPLIIARAELGDVGARVVGIRRVDRVAISRAAIVAGSFIVATVVVISRGTVTATRDLSCHGGLRRIIGIVVVIVVVVLAIILVVLLALIKIGTSALQSGQDVLLITVDNGVVCVTVVVVPVALAVVGTNTVLAIITLNRHGLNRGPEVASVLNILGVPVNQSTGPLNCTLRVALKTAGPDRKLHTGWGLRKLPVLRSLVPSVLALLGSADLAIDEPLDLVRGPANFVVVPVVEGIGKRNVLGIGVCAQLVTTP